MKRFILALALVGGLAAFAQPARADSSWSVGFNLGLGSGIYSGYNVYPVYSDPAYYAPVYPVQTVVYDYSPVRYYNVPTYYPYPYGSTMIYRSYYGYPSYAFYPYGSFNFSYNHGSSHYRDRYPSYRAPVYHNYYNGRDRDRDWNDRNDRNDRGNGNWDRGDRNDRGNGNRNGGDRNDRGSNNSSNNGDFSDYQRNQFNDPGLKFNNSLSDMQPRNNGIGNSRPSATSIQQRPPVVGNRMLPDTGVRGSDVKTGRSPVVKGVGIDGDRASRTSVFANPARERVQQGPAMRSMPQGNNRPSVSAPSRSAGRVSGGNGGGGGRSASRSAGGIDGR